MLIRLRPIVSSLLAAALAAAALAAPAAPAAHASPPIYLVDRNDDVIVTSCDPLTPNDCSLRGAVQDANANPGSIIELDPVETYVLTAGGLGELVLSTTTTINSDNTVLCFIGPCTGTIQGGPGWTTRLLEVVPGAAVTVDHVVFTGGNANNGGAILNSGALTLTTSLIFSNTVSGYGGGILNYGSLTLTDTVVSGNKAQIVGGGIADQADVDRPGKLTIINSSLVTNSVYGASAGQGFGGGIASFDNISGTVHPALTLSNSSILSNTGQAVGLGGGLYLNGNNTLTNVTLQGNASGSGGGAFVGGQFSMQGGTVLSNTGVITGEGGGLYLNAVSTLTNVTVQGNSASGGGGIDVALGQLDMHGGSVVSNTATTSSGSGGGLRADGPLTLTNVLIGYNRALGGGAGGGLSSNAPTLITNSNVTHNHAEGSGGGIWLSGFAGLLTLDHSSLISNTALYGAGLGGFGSATITNTSVISDNAGYQGGGINVSGGGHVLLTGNSQVRNNLSSGFTLGTSNGGGIWNGGQVTIRDASVTGNVAGNGGGAGLYNNTGATASLARAALVGNQAQAGPGGGIANLSVLTITASAIVSNSSVSTGGAISNTGTLSLLNTTLSGNTASNGAGGLVNTGAATLNFVTIARNTASGAGGLATTGPLTMSNSLLGDNIGTPFDCAGTVTSLGHNLIGHTSGCPLVGPGTGDKKNIAPLITNLIDQGGALRFHDLLDFSPALEGADPAGGACPATDQRGVARPIHPRCDIGAIESSAVAYFYLFLPLVTK